MGSNLDNKKQFVEIFLIVAIIALLLFLIVIVF